MSIDPRFPLIDVMFSTSLKADLLENAGGREYPWIITGRRCAHTILEIVRMWPNSCRWPGESVRHRQRQEYIPLGPCCLDAPRRPRNLLQSLCIGESRRQRPRHCPVTGECPWPGRLVMWSWSPESSPSSPAWAMPDVAEGGIIVHREHLSFPPAPCPPPISLKRPRSLFQPDPDICLEISQFCLLPPSNQATTVAVNTRSLTGSVTLYPPQFPFNPP